MELYNALIKKTEELLSAGTPKVWKYSASDCWRDHGGNELVLRLFTFGCHGGCIHGTTLNLINRLIKIMTDV